MGIWQDAVRSLFYRTARAATFRVVDLANRPRKTEAFATDGLMALREFRVTIFAVWLIARGTTPPKVGHDARIAGFFAVRSPAHC